MTRHIFDVRDYGATGDGVTDDTEAIQDAIDAACVNGGTVYFASTQDSYIITSALTISGAAIRILGDSGVGAGAVVGSIATASVIKQTSDGESGFLLGDGSEYTVFDGVAIVGPRDSSAGAAIYLQDDPDGEVHINNVRTDGFYYGLRTGSTTYHTRVFASHFLYAASAAVYLAAGGTSHDFYGCKMDKAPIGLFIGGHFSVGVYGGEIEGNTQYGVVVDGDHSGGGAAMTFQGVYFEQVGNAVEADILIGQTEPVYAVNITGCLFVDSTADHWNIDVKEGHYVTIMGCDLWSDNVLRVDAASSNVVLINNHNRNSGTTSGTFTSLPS